MGVFWTSIQSVLSIVIMMAVGYFCRAKGWFGDKFSKGLSQVIMKIALPCAIFMSMLQRFHLNQLRSLSKGLIYTILAILIGYVISWIAVRVFKIPRGRRGLMMTGINGANTVFIGLPLNVALFGNVSIPYLLVYYIVNTIIIWTLGVWVIAADDPTTDQGKAHIDWKHFLPAPIWGFIIALPFLLWMPNAATQLPPFITRTLTDIGGLVTPLSLMYIGIMLRDFGISNIRFTKSLNLSLIGRFIVSPLIMFAIITVGLHAGITLTPIFHKTLIIQAATPSLAVLPILADQYHGDVEFATDLVVATSVLFVIVVPVIMLMMSYL